MIDLGEVFFVADLAFGSGNYNFNLGGVVYQRMRRVTARTPLVRQLKERFRQSWRMDSPLSVYACRAIEKFEIGRDIV